MRLRIELRAPEAARVPVDHQDLLGPLVYRLLQASDPDYSRMLHDEGFLLDGGGKRFKLFCYSNLRVADRKRRRLEGDRLWIAPGMVEWYVASPVESFMNHFASGLLAQGEIRVGPARFCIAGVEALQTPAFGEVARFTCLTPVVASLPDLERKTARYLRPWEGEAFSAAVRGNLLRRYRLACGGVPADDRLELRFDAGYLARDRHGGTKKVSYKGIEVVGALAPFTLSGSAELMKLAWEGGLGEKNSAGFGMVEVCRV